MDLGHKGHIQDTSNQDLQWLVQTTTDTLWLLKRTKHQVQRCIGTLPYILHNYLEARGCCWCLQIIIDKEIRSMLKKNVLLSTNTPLSHMLQYMYSGGAITMHVQSLQSMNSTRRSQVLSSMSPCLWRLRRPLGLWIIDYLQLLLAEYVLHCLFCIPVMRR